jgi:hypothetical protein
MYPKAEHFVNSTAAARVNGYLSGHGNLEEIESELGSLGLSPKGERMLMEAVKRSHTRWKFW